jgi:hypothetical protein
MVLFYLLKKNTWMWQDFEYVNLIVMFKKGQ